MEEDALAPLRALRGLVLISVSVLVIGFTGIAYVHPSLDLSSRTGPAAVGAYRVSALDFVDSSTGWVVADLESGNYALLHTADGGFSWTRQLAGADRGRSHYLKFFDTAVGVLGEVGTAPGLLRTSDGGRTWKSVPVPNVHGQVLSWSWVDSYFGWVLVSGTDPVTPLPTYLFRTVDGGVTWQNLGVPAPAPDQVFQIDFPYFTTGWLTSANAGPYAYKTGDYGETWTRVALPAPAGGWPSGGTFLVEVQPTSGEGLAATVVFVPSLHGRKGQGGVIRDFPPLVVGAFDGGRPVTYTYATAIVQKNLGPLPQTAAPNEVQYATSDDGATWHPIASPPSPGAIGFSDAATWWWVGQGRWATSRDGGTTWTSPQPIDARAPEPGSLVVLDRLHAWFAGSDATRPALETTSDGGRHWRLVPLPAIPDSPTTP